VCVETKRLQHPATSPVDFHGAGWIKCGGCWDPQQRTAGQNSLYMPGSIVPSGFKFGAMAAVGGRRFRSVGNRLWKSRTGKDRTSCRCPEKIGALLWVFRRKMGKRSTDGPCFARDNPFFELSYFRKTREGVTGYVNITRPQARALNSSAATAVNHATHSAVRADGAGGARRRRAGHCNGAHQ